MPKRLIPALLALLSGWSAGLDAADPAPADLAASKAPENGLAIQVGAQDERFLAALTLGGRRLVQGLVADDGQQARLLPGLIRSGAHPSATVAVWDGAPRLPYADRLVNLLILDRDALGAAAPSPAECLRVAVPGGVILERSGGKWSATSASVPAGLADWTHFDGGADGNAVSRDTEVTGIRGLQWIDNLRERRWFKNSGHGGEGGNIRIVGRFAVIDAVIDPDESEKTTPVRPILACRDVFNGLLIWQKARPLSISAKRWALAAGEGRCFTWLAEDGPLTALDLASGEAVATYPGSEIRPVTAAVARPGKAPKVSRGINGEDHWVRVAAGMVLANGDGGIRAWTIAGKPLWSFARAGFRFEMPAVDAARGMVYGFMVADRPVGQDGRGPVTWMRWTTSGDIASIVALDLASGAVKWENSDVASRETDIIVHPTNRPQRIAFGQLLADGGVVYAYNSKGIFGGEVSFLASIDAATGKTMHFDPRSFVSTSGIGRVESAKGYCCIARDGMAYTLGGFDISSFDPRSGEVKRLLSVPWNARCHKAVATVNDFIVGQTAFIGKDYSGEMPAVARSGCAHSPVPGAGLLLFGPHTCACVTHLDGYIATSPRPMGPPVADGQRRIVLADAKPQAASGGPGASAGLIGQSWSWFTISEAVAAVEVDKVGWSFRIEPERHRLSASKGGATWSFTADARIATDFAVVAGMVVIGCHDGQVFGLDLATGAARWRHLVAPGRRAIVANGMLSSAWPVLGVADLGGGQIVASAGTHVEFDGGIRVAALRAADGSAVWVKNLHVDPSRIPAGGGKGTEIIDHTLINSSPSVVDGKVVFDGGHHLGRLSFPPDEAEAAINRRLASPSAK